MRRRLLLRTLFVFIAFCFWIVYYEYHFVLVPLAAGLISLPTNVCLRGTQGRQGGPATWVGGGPVCPVERASCQGQLGTGEFRVIRPNGTVPTGSFAV